MGKAIILCVHGKVAQRLIRSSRERLPTYTQMTSMRPATLGQNGRRERSTRHRSRHVRIFMRNANVQRAKGTTYSVS